MTKQKLRQLEIIIPGRSIPKPRMTSADKYKRRPIVMAYWDYVASVQEAYYLACNKQGRPMKFDLCAFGATIVYAGSLNTGDIDNIIKGIKDSLTKVGTFPDDTMQYVRQYDKISVISLCDICVKDGKCRAIKQCDMQHAIITIRDLGEQEITENINELF